MPYVITHSTYPPEKAKAVAQKYLEMIKKYPPDETLGTDVVPAAVKMTSEGIKVLGVGEVKKGKLEDALSLYGEAMAMFHDIEGFRYSVDVYGTLEEAMALIGVSMPK